MKYCVLTEDGSCTVAAENSAMAKEMALIASYTDDGKRFSFSSLREFAEKLVPFSKKKSDGREFAL